MAISNEFYNMEGEYRIMNSEIEAKTAEYLKKADEIVRNQEESIEELINTATANDNACGDSININETYLNTYRCETSSSKSESEDQYANPSPREFTPVHKGSFSYFSQLQNSFESNNNNQETSHPKSVKLEREYLIINSLKTKIKALQEECFKKTEQLKKRNAEMESIKKTSQRLQEDKTKLYSQINNLKSQTTKYETKIGNLTDRLQGKENECKVLCSEIETLNKNAKDAKQNISRLEVRLARALDDYATTVEQLSAVRTSKRELTESSKKKIDELTIDLEKSKRKNQTAMSALVKQAQLVDNLKRQIAFLKTGKEVKSVDEKLDNLLQWHV